MENADEIEMENATTLYKWMQSNHLLKRMTNGMINK